MPPGFGIARERGHALAVTSLTSRTAGAIVRAQGFISVAMAIAHTMEEDDGNAGHGGDDLDLQVVVPEDVQAVMNAAEEGDAGALSTALGLSQPAHVFLFLPASAFGIFLDESMRTA